MKIDFEKVLADYGLKVGDKVRFTNHKHFDSNKQFEIIGGKRFYLKCGCITASVIDELGEFEWEKVEPKKTVGDLICGDIACYECLLCGLACKGYAHDSVKSNWQQIFKQYPNLEPIREYIEKELNKEVNND